MEALNKNFNKFFKIKILRLNITRLSDSNRKVGIKFRFVRARINLAPTQQVKQRSVGAGFTPARNRYKYLEITQFRLKYMRSIQ